jgi:hypothetical protein
MDYLFYSAVVCNGVKPDKLKKINEIALEYTHFFGSSKMMELSKTKELQEKNFYSYLFENLSDTFKFSSEILKRNLVSFVLTGKVKK